MYYEQPNDDHSVITRNDQRISSFMETIDRLDRGLDELEANHKPALYGERYLTDKQLSQWLHISRCTLQEHRNAGKIPYYMLGGKILYKESDIDRLLKDNFLDVIP